MDTPKPKLPEIPQEERTPLVDTLLEMLAWYEKRIELWKSVFWNLKKKRSSQKSSRAQWIRKLCPSG
jgi:hypothetical protein